MKINCFALITLAAYNSSKLSLFKYQSCFCLNYLYRFVQVLMTLICTMSLFPLICAYLYKVADLANIVFPYKLLFTKTNRINTKKKIIKIGQAGRVLLQNAVFREFYILH